MQLTQYPSIDQFVHAARAFLEHEEALNNLLLGTALRLRDSPAPVPFCATVDHAGELLLAALLSPYELVLSGPGPAGRAEIAGVVEQLRRQGRTVPRVTGPVALAGSFAEQWSDVTGASIGPAMRMQARVLRQVEHAPAASGQLRQAQAADAELVADWMVAFDREAVGDSSTHAEAYADAQRRIAGQEIFVWDDGRSVAMAGTTRRTWHGCAVNAVYTPPALRGRGYATACVAALSRRLLEGGLRFCTLFSDVTNHQATAIYEKVGYRPLAEFAAIRADRTIREGRVPATPRYEAVVGADARHAKD